MSTVVWSPTKGWHLAPAAKVVVAVRPNQERAKIAAMIHAASQKGQTNG